MTKTRGILIWALLMIYLLATPTAWGSDQEQEQMQEQTQKPQQEQAESQPAITFSNGKELGSQFN